MSALRIVRMANFVAPASGGLRTALRELGAGYHRAGHEAVLIIPGSAPRDEYTEQGRVITLPGHRVPGTGGYRVLTDRRRLARLLEVLAPDRLEVSDRTTLRWTGEWARCAGVPSVMVSHESVDGVLGTWGVPPAAARRTADLLNRRTAHSFDRILCTTDWAAREFERVGSGNVVRAPLGVDLASCHPVHRSPMLHARLGQGARVLVALCSRLSPEKRPEHALDALAALRRHGVDAALVIAGDGPLRRRMEERVRSERLPAVFTGHIRDRIGLSALQASADVVLAPGPAETFGLAALEALACGTPIVASAHSAVPAILGSAGVAAAGDGESFADGVQQILARPEADRRAAARERAEQFPWGVAVDAFLAAHDMARVPSPAGPAHRPALVGAVRRAASPLSEKGTAR